MYDDEQEVDPGMSYANELVRAVREDADLPLKAVAAQTHFSTSSINRYELGDINVPAEYLSRLFAMTHDIRVLQFIHPSIDLVAMREAPVRIPPPGDPRELMPDLVKQVKVFGVVLETAQRIVGDGIVDAEDDHLIATLLARSNELAAALVRMTRSVATWREASERRSA